MAVEIQPTSTRLRAAIVFNPKKVQKAALELAVAKAELRHDWSESLWFTSQPASSEPITQALEAGVDVVVVVGGDGTVRCAISAMLETDTPMAIIPSGTGNLLARELSLPLNDVDAAFDIAFGLEERNLDVIQLQTMSDAGKQRGDISVVMSGTGIDAAMIANTNPELKKRLGWVAYVDGVRRSLSQIEPFEAHISVDHGPVRTHQAVAVFVANLAELPGNVSLVPGAAVDDGLLDVIVLQPQRFMDWLFIWRRFSWENAVLRRTELGVQVAEAFKGRNRRQVAYQRGAHVHIEIDGAAQPFQVDGDSAGTVQSIDATVKRHGMRIKAPRPRPVALLHPVTTLRSTQ